MEVQEFWSMEYRNRRYLEHLGEEDLAQRAKDIISNYTTLTAQGRISLHPIDEGGELWIRLFTHVIEEYRLRNKWFPPGFMKDAPIPKPTWPQVPKAVEAIRGRRLIPDEFLVKYGESRYLKPTLERGIIRIAPASSYNDPSLKQARKDNELEISWLSLPERNIIQVLDRETGKPRRNLTPVGNVKIGLEAPNNYYVYCLSYLYSLRLFDDFEADSCLIISRPLKFIERLFREFDKQLPGWKGISTGVSYIDPLNTKPDELNPFFYKHFRYAYQKECRIIWLPPTDEIQLDPIFLELGNLEEICELILL